MPDETIENRLAAIEAQINDAKTALDQCAGDLDIVHRVESANAREIATLKRHVAKLQADSRERGA